MRIIKKSFITICFAILVSSCVGSPFELEPVTIGKDPAELKVSPCACIKLNNQFDVSDLFVS